MQEKGMAGWRFVCGESTIKNESVTKPKKKKHFLVLFWYSFKYINDHESNYVF